jgi:hypothetical protein
MVKLRLAYFSHMFIYMYIYLHYSWWYLGSHTYIYEILYWHFVEVSDMLEALALVACATPPASFIPDIWGKRNIYPKTLAPNRYMRGHRREPPK